MRRLLFRTIHDLALALNRERVRRECGVLDSQTVKAPVAPRGGGAAWPRAGHRLDAAKRLEGRKRWPWLKYPFTDGAHDRGKLMSTAAHHGFVVEALRKLTG